MIYPQATSHEGVIFLTTETLASQMSEAIIVLLNGDKAQATKLVATVLQGLTAPSANTKPTAAVVPKAVVPRARKVSRKRRPYRALTGARLDAFNQSVVAGQRIAPLAKAFGISEPTAYRYAKRAIEHYTAPATQEVLIVP